MSPSTSDDFDTLWATLDVPAIPPTRPFDASLRPSGATRPLTPVPRDRPAIELRGELARSDRGVVHLGIQASLRREVAVKVIPRHASRDERAAVREALVAAHLEHPNIVPVYTVEADADRQPLIVMKRLDGVRWSECIAHPERAPRMREDDPLGWHLDIFAAICRAAQFAHDRGILHRDIRPDNVLVGHHGDVYLLEWGLAVALAPRLEARAPLASEVTRIAGTPGYMAPEMLRGDGAALGPRTDVYLLGATLHEVLTGRPRHTGADLPAVIRSTHASAPHEYGEDVPADLAAICNRATRAEPSERFASVSELAAAVRDAGRKRPAVRFLKQAAGLFERLREEARAAGADASALPGVYETFGQCRSAIDEALRIWPGNPAALEARDGTLRVMAAFEMERGNLSEAAELLGRLAEPDPELDARLETLRGEAAEREREYVRLKALERDLDQRLGARMKALIAIVFGALVMAHNVTYGRLRAAGAVGDEPLLIFAGPIVLILTMGFIGVLWRRGVFRNQANRQVLTILLSVGATVLGVRLIDAVHDVPLVETYSYLGGIYALGTAMVASIADRRIYASVAIMAAGAIGSVIAPAFVFEIIGSSVFLAMLVVAVVWSRKR